MKMRLSGGTLGLASVFVISACGAGTAGIIAGASDDGGSDDTTVTLELQQTKTSPATIRLKSTRPVQVDLRRVQGQSSTKLSGLSNIELEANVEKPVFWVFDADLNDPNVPSTLFRAITVFVSFKDRSDPIDQKTSDFGNEPPVIETDGDPPSEVEGVVPIRLRLSDTSGDVVSIHAQYQIEGEPEDTWHPARPAGLLDSEETPDPALKGQEAPKVDPAADPPVLPRQLIFFWDSNFEPPVRTDFDLHERERFVRMRFKADDQTEDADGDPIGISDPVFTPWFIVDNNEEPIVQLDSGPILANTDERRGIPVPFRVVDEEGDAVEVILQWRRQSEDFPSLDLDPDGPLGPAIPDGKLTNAEVDSVLNDPAKRAELHVCTPHPHFARGLVIPRGERSVRLPELSREMNWIVASGLVDRTLELLRPSSIPEFIARTWEVDVDPLKRPSAAVPIGDGTTALVLEASGGSWILRAIDLATGRTPVGLDALPVSGPGLPTAMCVERGEGAVLVASDISGAWRIARVNLATGSSRQLFLSDGIPPESVRGIASLARGSALFTVDSSLFHLEYDDSSTRLGALLTGLASAWGVAADLLEPARAYVSERGANRILSVELDTHAELPLVVKTDPLQTNGLDRPEALALERGASRLLIVAGAQGRRQLFGLDLGARGGHELFAIGPNPAVSSDVTSVACGPDGLRLLAVPDLDELLVAAGVEQRRTIERYEPLEGVVTVTEDFDPDVQQGRLWRISAQRDAGTRAIRARPGGSRSDFVWSSGVDVPDGGPTFLRALARDNEIGLLVAGAAPKTVRSSLDVDPVTIGGPAWTTSPRMTALGDLDGDGALDIVAANQGRRPMGSLFLEGDNLTVFLQSSPGVFPTEPSHTLGGSSTTPSAQYVALGDLNGDGRLDIASANRNRTRNAAGEPLAGGDLTVFFQDQDGSFPRDPSLTLGGLGMPRKLRQRSVADGGSEPEAVEDARTPPITQGPTSLAIADLDSDGLMDLVSANEGEPFGSARRFDDLTIFLQRPAGGFSNQPSHRLGDSTSTRRPQSVAIGDLNSDGLLDVVSANEDGDNLTVFLQDPRDGIPDQPSLALGNSTVSDGPEFVAIGDIDGDGTQDLVSVNENTDNLRIFYQDQPGTFTASEKALGGSPFTVGPEAAALGDVDGNGNLDIVTTNEDGSNLAVFYQVTPKGFSPASTIGGPGETDDPHGVTLGDVDGDGDLDLVSANDVGNDLDIFFQKTAGSFAPPLPVGGFPTTNQPVCIAFGDLDGDGNQDLVSGNRDGDDLTVFYQELPGSFVLGEILPDMDFPHSIACGDLDGDGRLDLVSANKDGSELAVFIQDDGFVAADPLGNSITTLNPRSVAVGDLDGDGDQDVVSANEGNDSLSIFLVRDPQGLLPAGDAPYFVAISDLDLDGALDLVSANRGGSSLSLFIQDAASGAFIPHQTLGDPTTTFQARSIAIGDLDGDGDPDIASANEGGDNLTLFFQDDGSFGSRMSFLGSSSTTDAPFSVAICDLDEDGDQDLVSANVNSNTLTVFFQNKLGSFGSSILSLGKLETTPAPWSVVGGDLDGDGDRDIVSANRGTDDAGDFRDGKLTVFWGGR